MRVSSGMIELLKDFEASGRFEPKAYKCPAGVWTIGYGHTGKDVYAGLVINKEQAEALLRKDVAVAEVAVEKAIGRTKLTQWQFDALVSFTFNLGSANLRRSTLLKMVVASPSNINGIVKEFAKWKNAGGKELMGLKVRRVKEACWYAFGRCGEDEVMKMWEGVYG